MAQKYIGSTISLISRLDIRYEGVLYAVNSAESTITLAKVRCYGTEDRPSAHPVLSRDEVYEYIIFKACDIKDLVVCEPPNRGLPRDPAIVSFAPYRSRPGLGKSVPNILNLSQRSDVYGNRNFRSFPAPFFPNNMNNLNRSRGYLQNNRFYGNSYGSGMLPNIGMFRPNMNNGNNTTRRYGNGINVPSSGANRIKFDSDYDFQKANERFIEALDKLDNDNKSSETTIIAENGDPDAPSKASGAETSALFGTFYDKNKSFFDYISCETREKEEGKNVRPNWKKERLINQETFGCGSLRDYRMVGAAGQLMFC